VLLMRLAEYLASRGSAGEGDLAEELVTASRYGSIHLPILTACT
jgi:hypothetical protein